ncbi:hydroxymethylbilane synthase, partial [Francisellaceae bacterium]|nr:hydroxymethylbilane synthase [Francisellaceae bacterium]
NISIDLNPMKTRGDIILDQPLNKIGGKALFMKELEYAMLEGRADFAVHSLKDVPYQLPEGFQLAAFCLREDPRDALVSNHHNTLDDLPKGAKVGTSSLRRASQLLYYRPDLSILPLRGNVQTRLQKLDDENYDAIVLAAAGLIRLNLKSRIKEYIDPTICLPAVGQGVIVIEALSNQTDILNTLKKLNHSETQQCILAERSFNESLEGGCHVPVAAHATIEKGIITLTGLVGCAKGTQQLKATHQGINPLLLGKDAAKELIQKGAKELLQSH